jgi:hypothetical protein
MTNAIYFVDTAIPADKKKRRKEKVHVAFDGNKVFRVKKPTELEDASEIYVDALFPELYDEVLELLRKNVRVYLLKDTIKLKRLRMENNLKKSNESDAVLLARIPRERFKPLTIEEVELKIKMWPLINKYERIVRWKKTLKKLIKDGFDYNFKESIRLMEADRKKLSREIIRQVVGLPIYGEVYRRACEILGVDNSTELAILTLELPLHWSLQGLRGLLGLNPNRTKGRYSRRLRHHITAFAANLYMKARKYASVFDKIIKITNYSTNRATIHKLQLITLKALRVAYLATIKTAGPMGSKNHKGQ